MNQRIRAATKWIWRQIEVEDAALVLAIGLLSYGFSLCWRPGAYLAPAAVILWIYVPSRYRFVVPQPETAQKRKARDK